MTAKRRKTKPTPRVKASESDTCFVIMPFGGWFDDYYISIFVPAIEAAGLAPKRADDLYRPSVITTDIWSYTKTCRLLLADLTGKNPNVFYELGLAHALAKPAILITESMEDVPFDLRSLRVIVYDKNAPDWGTTLKSKIKNAISETLKAPEEAVLPAFLNLRDAPKKPALTQQEKDILSMKQELEALRREIPRLARRVTHEGPGMIAPEEAEGLMRTFVRRGIPAEIIVDRITSRGVPEAWIRDKLREFTHRRTQPERLPIPAETEKLREPGA